MRGVDVIVKDQTLEFLVSRYQSTRDASAWALPFAHIVSMPPVVPYSFVLLNQDARNSHMLEASTNIKS